MRNKFFADLLVSVSMLLFVAGCTDGPATSSTAPVADFATPTQTPTITPTPFDPRALLEKAVNHFVEASSFQMSAHEVVSYQANTIEGTVRTIYGEFKTVYDYLRSPESKVHVHSQFRYSPDSDFIDEEYYLFDQDDTVFMVTSIEDGIPTIEETGGQSVDGLIGDAYQAILQYGTEAHFTEQADGEVVYTLDHPAWYTLQGAISFADLGLLYAQPDGAEMVREYAEQAYPNVQPVRFILHVSIADEVITKVELDNRDFMKSVWEAYDQALIDQGADPDQLTQYEIQPDHHTEVLFTNFDEVPNFNLPNY